MKKISLCLIPILLFTLIFPFVSCSKEPTTLIDQGQKIISLMDEMIKSEEYAKAYVSIANTDAIIKELREQDRTEPIAVYKLTVPAESLVSSNIDMDKMSDELEKYLIQSSYTSFASKLQLQGSYSENVTVSAMYATHSNFVDAELKIETVYLYVFEDGYPISVTFLPGENGAVRGTGHLILLSLFDASDADAIEKSCTIYGIPGVKATKIA